MLLLPSIACADPLHFGRDIDELVASGITTLHFDVMDGHLVKNFALSPDILKAMKQAYPDIAFDVHIMASNPLDFIQMLAACGASYITFHQASGMIEDTIQAIHGANMKAGLAINPDEALGSMLPYLPMLDLVLVMGIQPGFPGLPMADGTLERIRQLAFLRKEQGYQYQIIIDGGADNQTARPLQEAGADMAVLGYRSLFKQPVSIGRALEITRNILK